MNELVVCKNIHVSYYLPKGFLSGGNKTQSGATLKGLASLFLTEIPVLKGIDITLYRGQRIGVVGVNGAGKSTFLKALVGALAPSLGSVEVKGEIASVLSLGGGVVPALSGRRNVVLKYHSCPSPRYQLDEFMALVEEESGLGHKLDMPVSTYSAGMKSRLDRAMLNLIDGEIFVFDEWVVLGDKIATDNDAQRNSSTRDADLILLASHSESLLREWTDELIWLHEGKIREYGAIDTVLKNYQNYVKNRHKSG